MDRGVTVVSSRIEQWQLRPGDHIYTWRGAYSHHGIYESDEKVIHFNPSGVAICSLDGFLKGHELRLFAYAVPQWFYTGSIVSPPHPQPTCTMEAEDSPETVLRRANNLHVHGFGCYNLVLRNCMDFAFYCKTGRPYYGLVDGASAMLCALCEPSGGGPGLGFRVPEVARVVPPPPPPPRRRRPPEWLPDLGRFELPQPTLGTIAWWAWRGRHAS